jgi:hypothetical protein
VARLASSTLSGASWAGSYEADILRLVLGCPEDDLWRPASPCHDREKALRYATASYEDQGFADGPNTTVCPILIPYFLQKPALSSRQYRHGNSEG